MFIASIDGIAYNSQSCQIMLSKHFRNKILESLLQSKKSELNWNKCKFGLNDYKLNSNWTKNIYFGLSIWAGSKTKLMLTTAIP